MRFFLLLAALIAGSVAARAADDIPSAAIEIGRSYTLASAVLGGEREINVWLPPRYASNDHAYGVLYVIDGGREQDFEHIAGLAQLGAITYMYEPLIVIGIKTDKRLYQLTPPPQDPRYVKAFPETGGAALFRDYIAKEVIPFVEKSYRTNSRRAVIGESLAGLFITETFLKQPELFTDYIAVSPSLWWDDQRLAKAAPDLLAKQDARARRLYFTMGDEGGTMQQGLDKVLAALRARPPKNLDWTYVDRRTSETHGTIYHGAALDALRKLFAFPEEEEEEKRAYPWYLRPGGQPEEDAAAK